MPATDLEQIVNLCKRRGFVYPSAEIYGGFRSSYDYGPLGSLMLRNVKDSWVRTMVQERDDVVLIDAAILGPPAVFEASGHLANFSDPLVDCTVCKKRFREDQLDARDCPNKMKGCTFTEARAFNLMFQTHAGPVEGEGATVYMRPETAQGMFVNFANVLQTSRKKPPFGIAQVGKSFRNEITPGNFIFRTREFEQMEMEFFVPPAESSKWYEYWCNERLNWYIELVFPPSCCGYVHTTPTSFRIIQPAPAISSLSFRGVGESWKESRSEPTSISIATPSSLIKSLIISTKPQTSVMCLM